jgi:hypothetical protein
MNVKPVSPLFIGGGRKPVLRAKVIDMYPYIVRSEDSV